jgi:hypothetical protein
MESLADYLDRNLDRMMEITPQMRRSLNRLFEIWNARNITVDDFRCKYGMASDDGVFTIIPFMTANANNPEYINISEEEPHFTFFM